MPKQTKSLPLFDFSRGMQTVSAKEMIPDNALAYVKNVMWDEKNRLSKVFGSTALLAAANNAFATSPIYNLYNYIEQDGAENLIVQGIIAAGGANPMRLWVVKSDQTAAPINITPSGVNLAVDRQIHFATHKGHLYATDGTNHLMRWSGATTTPTEGWVKYHTKSFEKFRFLCAGSPRYPRLYAAHSWNNPIRVIYTEPNQDAFYKYYGGGVNPETGVPYIGDESWMDFPTSDGTPVTGIIWFQDSLIVTKPNHIFRVYGDPSYGVTIACVAHGLGCVAHESLAIRNDNTLIFMAKDGIWAGGSDLVYASAEDQSIRTKMEFRRVTTEIDDYWRSYVTVPDLSTGKSITKAGATDLATFTTATQFAVHTPIDDDKPVVINYAFRATETTAVINTATVDTAVALTSFIDSISMEDVWYANTFKFTSGDSGVVNKTTLWLSYTDTDWVTHSTTCKLNVYMCGTTTDDYGQVLPDLNKKFAEGQIIGNAVVDTTSGTAVDCTLSYWDYPQTMYGGLGVQPTLALVVVPSGDTATSYISWWYKTGSSTYGNGQMCNADETTPGTQDAKDYYFVIYNKRWYSTAQIVTSAFQADADIDRWINVSYVLDEKTLNGYTRTTQLKKLEYALSTNGTAWDSYVEVETGGGLTGGSSSKPYIKFRFTFMRPKSASAYYQDSFTLVSIKATYATQTKSPTIVKGLIWEGRYLLACNIADSG